ncbi:MAG: class I SAM-dependent methyltransferase [Candidatus Methanomethylophilaceae archaeon]|nr:class I SAM-dependent methyltransferase [Candidatus Methanomethylophilaceae archaeon]
MSKIHPSVGEGMSHQDMISFWDQYSECYSSMQQGDIPDRIVGRLFELGMLRKDDSVMELGSGPGTYSLRMAPRLRILTCMDSSERMLVRLSKGAESMGLHNIELFCKDWSKYVPRKGYDACIATLCPGTGSPESIERMEKTARRSCILVSWVTNHGDDLNARVWQALGKDYGYDFRDSTVVQDYLTGIGREPIVEFFRTGIEMDIPVEELVKKEESAFRPYGINEGIGDIVRSILEPESDGGVVHYSAENEMKMICWNVPDPYDYVIGIQS